MRNWFIFGSGIFVGIIVGAVSVSFFFFDDVSKSPPPSIPAKSVTLAKTKKKIITPSATLMPEGPPTALPAAQVNPDALPAEESTVISTVKSDRPGVQEVH